MTLHNTEEWLKKEIERHEALEALGIHEPFNPFPIANVVVCPGIYLPPITDSCYVDITEQVNNEKKND